MWKAGQCSSEAAAPPPAGLNPSGPTNEEGRSAVRTYSPKPGDIQRNWHVIDATDVVLGRLASHAAQLLRGKHKPTFAPHTDVGDFVIIIMRPRSPCPATS
jgi:hypothetical protein